jgi:GNAT superfamily N-acetyltransferase
LTGSSQQNLVIDFAHRQNIGLTINQADEVTRLNLTSVRMAENADDFEIARALCREWIDWHWHHYPSDWPKGADHPMDPQKFEAIVQDLPNLHQRPRGGIFIGSVDGNAAGCLMYHEAAAGIAEFKRMFVNENGRGYGLGRLMLERMFEQMISDGYQKVFFSSATFLTHARAMYERAGFLDIPHPAGFPNEWRDRVYFMERTLV